MHRPLRIRIRSFKNGGTMTKILLIYQHICAYNGTLIFISLFVKLRELLDMWEPKDQFSRHHACTVWQSTIGITHAVLRTWLCCQVSQLNGLGHYLGEMSEVEQVIISSRWVKLETRIHVCILQQDIFQNMYLSFYISNSYFS